MDKDGGQTEGEGEEKEKEKDQQGEQQNGHDETDARRRNGAHAGDEEVGLPHWSAS